MENNENKHSPEQNESNAAKRLRMLGDDMSEEIHLKSDAEVKGNFWENFWYQHKWAIIFCGIALVMLIILGFTMCNDKKEDMNIIYVGPEYVLDKVEAMNSKLQLICGDYDENGEVVVNFPTITHQSPEQRESLSKTHPEKLLTVDANNKALAQFESQIMSGELAIYLIDPYLYELKAKHACLDLTEVLGYEPDSELKYDSKAIYFSKTDFAIHFDEFDSLPADTIMCVVKTVATDSDFLEDSKDLFKKIVEFEAQ